MSQAKSNMYLLYLAASNRQKTYNEPLNSRVFLKGWSAFYYQFPKSYAHFLISPQNQTVNPVHKPFYCIVTSTFNFFSYCIPTYSLSLLILIVIESFVSSASGRWFYLHWCLAL